MLGDVDWSLIDVKNFLDKRVYTIPSFAEPKNDNPFGRIIHNYSFSCAKLNFVNSTLKKTSVKYISFLERVELANADWYVEVDKRWVPRLTGTCKCIISET